jgi:hypothetical protein
MTEAQKQKIIDEVLSEMDFEKVFAIMTLCRRWRSNRIKTVDELRAHAQYLLSETLEHTDRDTWWIRSGFFFVLYDHNHGITLQYVPFMSRVSIPEIREIESAG